MSKLVFQSLKSMRETATIWCHLKQARKSNINAGLRPMTEMSPEQSDRDTVKALPILCRLTSCLTISRWHRLHLAKHTHAHTHTGFPAGCPHCVQYSYVVKWISTAIWRNISTQSYPLHVQVKPLLCGMNSLDIAFVFAPSGPFCSCELTVCPFLNCAILPKEKVTKTFCFL